MMIESISPQITLKALFSLWPATMPVFLRHRMSCVGCSMAAFDSLEDAITNYGLDQLAFLKELQAAMTKSSVTNPSNSA
jgi:hybrid cluster-associated redox disulfide protein